MEKLQIYVSETGRLNWQRRADQAGQPLSRYVTHYMNRAPRPSWDQLRPILLAALPNDPAWGSWLSAHVAPLFAPEPPDPRTLPAGEAEQTRARKDRQALYMRRARRKAAWSRDWGAGSGEILTGVLVDLRKRGAAPELLDRAKEIRDSGAPDWMDQYLDLFDPL